MSSEPNPCETHRDVETPGGFCPVCLAKEVEREAERAAYWEKEAQKMKHHAFRHKDWADRAESERDTARQEAANLRSGVNKALYHIGRSRPVTARSALEEALHSSSQMDSDENELKTNDAPASEPEKVCMCGLSESEHDSFSEPIHTFTPMDEYYATDPVPADRPETDAASEALKPCPFCGGRAELKKGEECAIAQCLSVSAHRLICDGDNNCAEEITKLWNQRVSQPMPTVPEGMEFHKAMQACQRGLEAWSSKPHNKRWWKRIDGTPIPNDLLVEIALQFAAAPDPAGEEGD